MPNFNVILDTNIFRKNPSRSDLPFKALERLCKAEVCRLHLPYVVQREFQTQQMALYQKELSASLAALEGVMRKGLPAVELATVTSLRDAVKAAEPAVLAAVEAELPAWADAIGSVRHSITEAAAQSAMEAYFCGHPPLTNPKTRDDIPDAFIFQTIKDIASLGPKLIVVAEDGKLAKAAETLPNVVVHRSLVSMIESEFIQTEILELDVIENITNTAKVLRDYEAEYTEFRSYVNRKGAEKIVWRTVHSSQIPDDNHEATISSYCDPEDVEVDFDGLSYFGSGQFGLPFEFRCTVEVIYYIFKSDYYCLDEDHMPSVTDHNDHYFEAEDEREVHVSGTLRLSFPIESIKTLAIETVDKHIDIGIDSIDAIDVVEN